MHIVCPARDTANRIAYELLQDDAVCGRCRAALVLAEPMAPGDAALSKFIARTKLVVLVDFSADQKRS